ncbi:MAG TPA: hypothetical protein VF944_05780, partial [Candidatus Bathyarchaeia archaeon]
PMKGNRAPRHPSHTLPHATGLVSGGLCPVCRSRERCQISGGRWIGSPYLIRGKMPLIAVKVESEILHEVSWVVPMASVGSNGPRICLSIRRPRWSSYCSEHRSWLVAS